jgi:glycosyltransferase involved in cell wall biosynthesis
VYQQFCEYSKRTDVQYNLVYPALNHQVFKKEKIKQDNNIFICLVARKHPWKGLITFLNVYRQLSIKYRNQILSIILISHDDLSSFDLDGITIVKPKSDKDIVDVYNISDIFISTSWWEGFGLPPLEAMACGCAVITSNSGGVNEYAIDNVNCLMFEPKNEKELEDKLVLLIENSYLRKSLSMEGIKTAQHFTWNNSSVQLLHIIE